MDALRSLINLRRPPKPTGLAALAAAIHAAAGGVAPPASLPLRALAGTALAGSALGWLRPIWFISVGYGVAMVLQAAAAAHLLTGGPAASIDLRGLHPAGRAALALHAAHGAWLALFLGARDALLPTYAPKRAAIDARSAKLGPGPKAGMWAGVAALYVALAVPAWAVAAAPAPVPGTRAAAVTAAGLALAAAGLWLEATADIVKSVDKARDPAGFSRLCVYRLCRQPNLLGEALFWWGLGVAAAPPLAGAPAAAAAAAAGLAAITSILVGDSAGKAANQARRMAGKAGWAAYAAATPVLWPLPRGGGGGRVGGPGRGGSARGAGRAAAAATPATPAAAPVRRTPRRPTPSRRVRE